MHQDSGSQSNIRAWNQKLVSVLIIVSTLAYPYATEAAVFDVDHPDDDPGATSCNGATPNDCSLRGAIIAANTLSEASTINVPAGQYFLTQGAPCSFRTSQFGTFNIASTTSLCIANAITLTGASAATTIIDGGQLDRVILVGSNAPAAIHNVTVRNGIQRGGSLFGGGGGVNTSGALTLTDSVIADNAADGTGGGIFNSGTLTLLRSSVVRNLAANNDGGGLSNFQSTATIIDSAISDNTTRGSNGGGIFNYWGTLTLTGSTVDGNTSSTLGGGIFNTGIDSTLFLINSTISGNSNLWSYGGGIYNGFRSRVELQNVTIANNAAGVGSGSGIGGGISNTDLGVVTLRNTVIAGNTASYLAPDCYGFAPRQAALSSQGYNLIQNVSDCDLDGDATGNITAQDAELGALASNGGPTRTHALMAGSPAIDAGNPAAPGDPGNACAVSDQRGLMRPLGAACDIGAIEMSGTFSLSGVLPNGGGSGGFAMTQISGDGFADGAVAKLTRTGAQDIVGAPVAVEPAGSAISTSFDLRGAPTGYWDLVVTNPDGTSATLERGFVIEEASAPELWVQIIGRNRVRSGRVAKYTILYGNRGNLDAIGVPLSLSTPASYTLSSLFDVTPPPPLAGQVETDWTLVPVQVSTGSQSSVVNVPLLLPLVPAGFTGVLRIELTVPPAASSEQIVAAIGAPFFDPDLTPQVVHDTVTGAQNYAQKALGVTLPPTLTPDLEDYAAEQFHAMVENGRASLVGSLGTETEVYSMSQLIIDLAQFGAAQVPAVAQTGAAGGDSPSWLSAIYQGFAFVWSKLGPTEAHAGPCTDKVLTPGGNCTDNRNVIPLPDDPKKPRRPFTPADCNDLPNHKVSADGNNCVPRDPKNCPQVGGSPFSSDPDCLRIPIDPRDSVDPNDKVGVPGGAIAQFIKGGTQLSYTIYFENLENAAAPAQEVLISDDLDAATMDLDTLSLGPITFAGITLLPLPGSSQFSGGVDLRPEQDLLVTVEADIDESTGVLRWRFIAIDPATGQLTEDPDAGFLPPNINPPEGDGSVTFMVTHGPGLPTGTEICNSASIIFDVNEPIQTPTWCNTIDDSSPQSEVLSLSPVQRGLDFEVQWIGTDVGAGVEDYTIYVAEDGAPYTLWLSNTPDAIGIFSGENGKTYEFYAVARDLAGNVEQKEAVAEARTSVELVQPVPGDLDGNGAIDRNDYIAFRATLGKCEGGVGYNPAADYDGDECISYADYRIWLGYYRRQ